MTWKRGLLLFSTSFSASSLSLSLSPCPNEKKFVCELKQRLPDSFIQERNAAVRGKDTYFPYHNVKSIFEPEQYLSALEIYCFRVGLCQLRLGVLPINNNNNKEDF